jgi:hypothetical protein
MEEPWPASVRVAQPSKMQRLKKSAGRLIA